jgi:hypothetical protein
MILFLGQSAIVLPCLLAAYAVSQLLDRFIKHRMPNFIRGLFILAVGCSLVATVFVVLVSVGCRFLTCDL